MGERRRTTRLGVLSRSWHSESDETGHVLRHLAGGLSRSCAVDVLVPGHSESVIADGAFMVTSVGSNPNPDPNLDGGTKPHPSDSGPLQGSERWPTADGVSLGTLDVLRAPDAFVVPETDEEALALLAEAVPDAPLIALASGSRLSSRFVGGLCVGSPAAVGAVEAASVPSPEGGDPPILSVGFQVDVNPLAAVSRHNGLAAVGYVLILSDRTGSEATDVHESVAWLTARFPRRSIVIIEDAVASVWKARALRGAVGVDTRTDLWRLMAHACVTIDLRPGNWIARECIESLRFETPVLAPHGSEGARLVAGGGGGLWFEDVATLLDGVEKLCDRELRVSFGRRGREDADLRFGNSERFVRAIDSALEVLGFA